MQQAVDKEPHRAKNRDPTEPSRRAVRRRLAARRADNLTDHRLASLGHARPRIARLRTARTHPRGQGDARQGLAPRRNASPGTD
jgi:hypothetical protein